MRQFTISRFVVVALLGAALCASCKEKPSGSTGSAEPGDKAAASSGQHAPSDVKPGSYEDWCAEHEVPESQCSRCNPTLSAAFKATGDWCEEHGVPESQCKACNPDLQIQRPAKK